MKRAMVFFGLALAVLAPASFPFPPGPPFDSPQAYSSVPDFGSIPLHFIPNSGLYDAPALFYARTSRYTLWLTKNGLVFDVMSRRASGAPAERSVLRLEFRGTNPDPDVVAADPSEYRVSYFEGNDPSRWLTGIPTSSTVVYRGVYPRIDLKIYGVEREVEYDWVVKPGGDPALIRFVYEDAQRTDIEKDGSLVVEAGLGGFKHGKPVAYQIIEGRRRTVEAAFMKAGKNEYGIKLGSYDKSLDLIIDPYIMAYASYLGGSLTESVGGLVVDGEGAIYIAGYTSSPNFPAPSRSAAARSDEFVTKISPDGTSLVYTAFLGIGAIDKYFELPGLAVDAAGAAYLAGMTGSPNFPVKNAFQKKYGGGLHDGYVAKIAPDGKSLVYSSYLGGDGADTCLSIAVDAKGAAYVTGYGGSSNLRMKNPFQEKNSGLNDGFVSKVAPNGKSLVYSTYIGGTLDEWTQGIAVDSFGAAYIAGLTESHDFPLKNPYQKANKGSGDLFITKFAPDGQSLVFSTLLGGPGYDEVLVIALGAGGTVYIAGHTEGAFPLKKPFQPARKGPTDAIVAELAADGQSLVFSTYLGGSGEDWCNGLAVDRDGAVLVTGETGSSNFPKKDACQPIKKGDYDAFVTKFSPTGQSLLFSTFLGGSGSDFGFRIAAGVGGEIYVAGRTNSLGFPLLKPYQKKYGGGDYDLFLSKYDSISRTR